MTPNTLNIRMSPRMSSDINPFIRSPSNNRRQVITDVGIFALAVAFPFLLRIPSSAIVASWKWIYIQGICNIYKVEHSERKPRVNIQSCVGYRVCFGTRGVVWYKSHDVEIVEEAAGVFNCGRCVACWRKRESRCRREEGIYILDFLQFGLYPAFCWLMNTTQPSHHLEQPPGTSWMSSLKTRFSAHGEDSLQCWALLWHHIPLLVLRPHASRSKLSSFQVVPTVQLFNTATNALQWKKHTQLMS
jgi:hypothetical protein